MLIFEAPDFTGMVTANVPDKSLDAETDARIRSALLSAEIVIGSDPIVALPFRFVETERFRLENTLMGTGAVFLDNAATADDDPASRTVFIISRSLSDPASGERRDIAMALMRSIDDVDKVEVTEEREITVDGLAGLEFLADCTAKFTDKPCFVYQVVLFHDGGYYRFVGLSPAADREADTIEFRALLEGFSRR